MSLVEDELAQVAQALRLRKRGLFIALEGGDGSGKTTQLSRLEEGLNKMEAPILSTFEPGGTKLGQELRRLLMHGPDDVDAHTEALLYAADRAYHANTVIRPALAAGTTVITDRYVDSSVAYQGIGRGLGVEAVRDLSLWATAGLLPDAVLLFVVEPHVGLGRLGEHRDRLESAGDEFHGQVASYYRQVAQANPDYYHLIDGGQTREKTFADTVRALVTVVQQAAE